jgi:hypothetical protein
VRPRIGIALAADRVRAVEVKRGRLLWALESEIGGDAAIASILRDLLAAAPLGGALRPRVSVALGLSCTQVKLLRGIPPLTSTRAVERLVREGARRLFLSDDLSLVTTGVRLVRPGTAWAAALDPRAVREVEEACRSLRLRLHSIAPAAVVLGHACRTQEFVWREGDFVLEARHSQGELVSARRYRASAPGAVRPEFHCVDALTSLGEDAWRFADAYGAAMTRRFDPLALWPGRGLSVDSAPPAWRVAVAAAVCMLALLAALLLPVAEARRTAAATEARIAAIDQERRLALRAEAELARVTRALAEVEAFARNRRSATLLLADLARILPDGSAIITIRIDTAAGHLVALSSHASAILDPLAAVPAILSPEIVGPVTREHLGGSDLERVTLRFLLLNGYPAEPGTGAPPIVRERVD